MEEVEVEEVEKKKKVLSGKRKKKKAVRSKFSLCPFDLSKPPPFRVFFHLDFDARGKRSKRATARAAKKVKRCSSRGPISSMEKRMSRKNK